MSRVLMTASLSIAMLLAACSGGVATGGSGGSSSTTASGGSGAGTTSSTTSGSSDCPSYASDVSPALYTYCESCHGPGGQESDNVFSTYASAAAKSAKIAGEINGGSMPPKNATAIPSAEASIVLAWIACGSPDN